ncbi:MAG: helix-turn-helix domain-containing protein [Planctomycetes bacterium]|nr:helix-turn-helix domain-containing protein [Planctomycetota bacterium]
MTQRSAPPPLDMAASSRLLTLRDAAGLLGMTERALRKWTERGLDAPPVVRLSERRLRIRADVLERWIESRPEAGADTA